MPPARRAPRLARPVAPAANTAPAAPAAPAPTSPPSWPLAAGLGAALFALYAATACRTVGAGDSGELTVAMATWGVPHAPGYPLLMLLGNLVSRLPHPGEPAFALNLLNAAFAAAACAALAVAVTWLTGRRWAGLVAGLALGTSPIFWEYALVVEVFSLNALLAALLLCGFAAFLRGIGEGRPSLRALPWMGLVMSTAITHHLTLALIALPMLVVLVASIPGMRRRGVPAAAIGRAALLSAGAGVLGLVLLVYIPIAARSDPPLNWGNARDAAGVLRLVTRQDFGSGWLTPRDVLAGMLLEHGPAASPFGLRHLGFFWADLPRSFGWLLPVLALVGLAATRRRPALLAFALLVLTATIAFFSRVNAPVLPVFVGITRPFYILPHLAIALLAGLGAAECLRWAERHGAAASAVVAGALLAGTGVAMLLRDATRVDARGDTFARDFGANLMAGMPRGAIVLSSGDLFRNAFHYQQDCLGHRRDLSLVQQPMMTYPWYVEELRRRGAIRLPASMRAYTEDPATQSRVWLDLNLRDPAAPPRPVVAVQLLDDTWRRGYTLVPMGLWSRVLRAEESMDLRRRADDYSAAVAVWATPSLVRRYEETSWPAADVALYCCALGSLRAVREIADTLAPSGGAAIPVPALAILDRWAPQRRAEALACEAESWRALRVAAAGADTLQQSRAWALAHQSLALDPANLQALRTLAALLHGVPRFRDPREEAAIRHRILAQRPGDVAELSAYLDLVAALMRDPRTADPAIARQAEADRRGFLDTVDLCLRFWPDPRLAQMREAGSRPVIPDAATMRPSSTSPGPPRAE